MNMFTIINTLWMWILRFSDWANISRINIYVCCMMYMHYTHRKRNKYFMLVVEILKSLQEYRYLWRNFVQLFLLSYYFIIDIESEFRGKDSFSQIFFSLISTYFCLDFQIAISNAKYLNFCVCVIFMTIESQMDSFDFNILGNWGDK